MRSVKLEGLKGNLNFKIGRRRFVVLDMIEWISLAKPCSKSEAKRLIDSGAISIQFSVNEIKET